jgi:hypothetical protein
MCSSRRLGKNGQRCRSVYRIVYSDLLGLPRDHRTVTVPQGEQSLNCQQSITPTAAGSRMTKLIAGTGSVLGIYLGWWLGSHLGMMSAFMFSIVGAAAGILAGRRFSSWLVT